jgi:hypothetical protein
MQPPCETLRIMPTGLRAWPGSGAPPGACSDDGALARSTSTVYAVHVQILQDGTPANWILGGYHHDVFARSPDGWRVRERIAIGTYEEGRFHRDARIVRGLADYTRPLRARGLRAGARGLEGRADARLPGARAGLRVGASRSSIQVGA